MSRLGLLAGSQSLGNALNRGENVHKKFVVLFESYAILNKKAIDRVLLEHPNSTIVVLENDAKKLGINTPIRTISDYYDLRELRNKVDKIYTLALKSLFEDPTFRSEFTIDGIFFLKLIREESIYWLLSTVIRKILIVERIISKERPSGIVVFESHNFLAITLPIPLGEMVIPVAKKHSVNVSVRAPALCRWILKIKRALTPLFFLRRSFKIYTLVRLKSLPWSDLRKKSEMHADVERKKVLFMPYSYAEGISLKPVLERLQTLNGIDCVAVAHPMSDERAGLFENQWKKRKNKIQVYSFGEYYPADMNPANRMYREVMDLWRRKKRLFYTSEALRLNGINLGELMKEKFDLLFKRWMKECVRYIFVAKEMLKREKPNLVLVSKERGRFMRCVLEAVSQQGIPSIQIQHGIHCNSHYWSPMDVTKICVDEVFRDVLIERGEDPKKIVVIGAPRYDGLFKKMGEDRDDIKKRLGLNQNERYLCLLTSFLPECNTMEKYRELLTTVLKSAKKINYALIIKLHPREERGKLQGLINKVAKVTGFESDIAVFQEENLFDIVLASDIVVSVRTSALITALVTKKTAILINFDPSVDDFYPGIEDKIFGMARSHAELFEMIKDVAGDPARAKDSVERAEKYARKYVPYENATDRVIDIILEMLENT